MRIEVASWGEGRECQHMESDVEGLTAARVLLSLGRDLSIAVVEYNCPLTETVESEYLLNVLDLTIVYTCEP